MNLLKQKIASKLLNILIAFFVLIFKKSLCEWKINLPDTIFRSINPYSGLFSTTT